MRKRKRELAQVKALDRTHLEPGESWYIISQQWLSSWLDFAGVGSFLGIRCTVSLDTNTKNNY
jgi:hypothetical protein